MLRMNMAGAGAGGWAEASNHNSSLGSAGTGARGLQDARDPVGNRVAGAANSSTAELVDADAGRAGRPAGCRIQSAEQREESRGGSGARDGLRMKLTRHWRHLVVDCGALSWATRLCNGRLDHLILRRGSRIASRLFKHANANGPWASFGGAHPLAQAQPPAGSLRARDGTREMRRSICSSGRGGSGAMRAAGHKRLQLFGAPGAATYVCMKHVP